MNIFSAIRYTIERIVKEKDASMEEHKDPGEEINREEEKEQEYSFLQETIKDETISKKKVKKDIFRRKTSRKRPSRFWTQKAIGRCSSL